MPTDARTPTSIDNILAAAVLRETNDSKVSDLYDAYLKIGESSGRDLTIIKQFYKTATEILHPSVSSRIKNYFKEIFYGRAS